MNDATNDGEVRSYDMPTYTSNTAVVGGGVALEGCVSYMQGLRRGVKEFLDVR